MAVGFAAAGVVATMFSYADKTQARTRAKNRQMALDYQNTQLYKKEVDESVRRTELYNTKTESTIKNQIGASGFAPGSSMDSYLETVQKEQQMDVDWMRTSGASKAAIMDRESQARKRNADANIKSEQIAGIGNIIGAGAGMFG